MGRPFVTVPGGAHNQCETLAGGQHHWRHIAAELARRIVEFDFLTHEDVRPEEVDLCDKREP